MSLATLAGHRVTSLVLTVPSTGVWSADCALDTDASVSGSAVLSVAGLAFAGTISPTRTAVYGARTRCRLVAGAGAWSKRLPARAYHNDLGVSLSTVVSDLARETGETLFGVMTGVPTRLDVDFVRQAGAASRSLVQAIGDAAWWVDFDGVTRVQTRAQSEVAGAYHVLDFDAIRHAATLALDDPSVVGIGSVLRDSALPAPLEVTEIEIVVADSTLRMTVHGEATT